MEQDLFDWLNTHANIQGRGLLVAPLSPEKHDDIPAPSEKIITENQDPPSENSQEGEVSVPEYNTAPEESSPQDGNDIQQEESAVSIQQSEPEESQQDLPADIPQDETPEYIPEYTDTQPDDIPAPDSSGEDMLHDHEWQERATGFTLSLDEPPPELWTHINDDDPEPDYEPTDSLQGAAYVQIHGRNFTERLHHTLKHRKERAEERAQAEHDSAASGTYIQKTVIFCACMLMALGFAFLALWFIGRETPDGMKRRAESYIEAGNFDKAAEIYRRAHRRYPDIAEFLAGLSEASRKAGHVQTAHTAHDEYIRLTSPDKPESVRIFIPQRSSEPEIPAKPAPVSLILADKPLTFQEYLDEANHAYNIGMYNRAVTNFFRAMEINAGDIRPYLGLSASYRRKGMYFDSYRIIEEARRKFGRSPALDIALYFLREAR